MYKDFYQCEEAPFNVTCDPGFFFNSSRHEDAFANLIYGIQHRKGILVVTGEIGTGKTTLCRTLINRFDHRTKTALILNPNFSEVQLLQIITKDFGIEVKQKNKYALISALNEFLLKETSQGHNVVLIIDEAQNLKPRQLEQIRLLSNLETEKEKLLQIVLVGQPELVEMLKLSSLRQLNQRVSVRFHVLPLEKEEIKNYIDHRLNVARATRQLTFTNDAIEAIYRYSGGTPRLINILCDRALLAGYVAGTFTIDASIINDTSQEVMGVSV